MSIDDNQGRGAQSEISYGGTVAGCFGAVALLAIGISFIWALWRAMEPVLMAWCSLAQFAT